MRRFLIVAAAALVWCGPLCAQTVPVPSPPPDQPLPGQSPPRGAAPVIIVPPMVPPPPTQPRFGGSPAPSEVGIGGRSPLGDTSPSARAVGSGGQALGDTSPSGRAVGEGGRAIGDTSPSSVGAPALRPPGPAPGEPGYTGSAAGIR